MIIIFESFLLSFIQEIIFVIPSSLVQYYLGWSIMFDSELTIRSFSYFFAFMVLPSSLGMLIGSIVFFKIINNFSHLLKFNTKSLENLNNKYPLSLFILITRSLPIFSNTLVTFFASVSNVPIKKFIIWSFFGLLIRSSIQGLIGWTGHSIYLNGLGGSFGLFILSLNLSIIIFIFYKLIQKNA